ncbi:Transcription factor Sp3, partial [Dissostichus eleginoides]
DTTKSTIPGFCSPEDPPQNTNSPTHLRTAAFPHEDTSPHDPNRLNVAACVSPVRTTIIPVNPQSYLDPVPDEKQRKRRQQQLYGPICSVSGGESESILSLDRAE